MAKTRINQRKKVLKTKKVFFQVSNKTMCDKEKKSKDRQNVSVGDGAGARVGVVIRIYGSGSMPTIVV
jgi:hypothetical protein